MRVSVALVRYWLVRGEGDVLEACEELLETGHHVLYACFELNEGLVGAGVGGVAGNIECEVALCEYCGFAFLADADVE